MAKALVPGDLIFSNHRCHGHFLARTGNVEGLIAEIMGKKAGVCGGRGGSQHLYAEGFYSNGVQGGIVPVAAGLALALQRRASSNIVVVFIGDGTLGEGVVYESMNIAAKWSLPLLIVLENNLYAQSTAQTQTLAGDICGRAASFGIETSAANTFDPIRLADVARACAEKVRHERKPHFLRVDTHRLMAHSKGDDNRPKEELGQSGAAEALSSFARNYVAEARAIQTTIAQRIDNAVAKAESDDFPFWERMTRMSQALKLAFGVL